MGTRTPSKESRPGLILQALYFASLSRVADLTEQERERLQQDLRYMKAGYHLCQIGLGGRRPRIPEIFYWPAELARARSVIAVKSPGEPLPDKPHGDVTDFNGYLALHDPEYLLLAINPSARESDIVSAVKKQVQAIKRRSAQTSSAGRGRKRSIDRMREALTAHDAYHRTRDPLSADQIGKLARTFPPIPKDRKGTAIEHFTHEDRGYKLLKLANDMIDTARKGRSAWIVAFPYVNEEPLA